MGDLWCLGTRCACNNKLSRKRSWVLLVWILSVKLFLKQPAYIDQNNRAEKDQSKTVRNGHWCGWVDMDEAVNSSTGLRPCCLYPETDDSLNPSLKVKRMCVIPKKQTGPCHDSFSGVILIKLKNHFLLTFKVRRDALSTSACTVCKDNAN